MGIWLKGGGMGLWAFGLVDIVDIVNQNGSV